MSMYDLTIVAKPTDREVTKINTLLKSGSSRDRRVETHLTETRNALVQELKEQIENKTATAERLAREKAHWFGCMCNIVTICLVVAHITFLLSWKLSAVFRRALHTSAMPIVAHRR